MKVMIVEDHRPEREYLARIVAEIPETQIMCCETAEAAEDALQQDTFDLFLLDVQLPGKSGFALAARIRAVDTYTLTPILFITGNERDCLGAFKAYHCYDYINKPVSVEELRKKIADITVALKNQAKEAESEKVICISSSEGDFFLKKSEILFVEIQGGTCIFHLRGRTLEKKGISLTSLLRDFDDDALVRCHKSFAVNTGNIIEIKPIDYRRREAHFQASKKTVEIGKKYYDAVILRTKEKLC